MSITAAIRRMIGAGLTVEQALLAAEAFEAEMLPGRTARQERNARQLDVSQDEWAELRLATFERDGYTCLYCGEDVSHAPQCDHIHPLALGGISDASNLATACKPCNSSKRDTPVSQWGGRRA